MNFHRSLEMSVTRKEFLRLLSAGVGHFELEGDTIHLLDETHHCTIHLVSLAERRLGSVAVPCHRVDIVLEACSEEEGEGFMARFHRAFLRGGG